LLGDGTVLVLSGLNDTSGSVNTTVQIFKAGAMDPGRHGFSRAAASIRASTCCPTAEV